MDANHARVLSGIAGCKLVGVADPDRQQRDLVTRVLGCPAVEEMDALLDLGVDAVTIRKPRLTNTRSSNGKADGDVDRQKRTLSATT